MPKRPKDHRRVPDLGLVGQHDLQDGNVFDDRGRDGRDEEQNRGQEEENHADPVACAVRTEKEQDV